MGGLCVCTHVHKIGQGKVVLAEVVGSVQVLDWVCMMYLLLL